MKKFNSKTFLMKVLQAVIALLCKKRNWLTFFTGFGKTIYFVLKQEKYSLFAYLIAKSVKNDDVLTDNDLKNLVTQKSKLFQIVVLECKLHSHSKSSLILVLYHNHELLGY